MRRFLIVGFLLALLLTSVTPVNAYYTNMNASIVLGQPDFTSNSSSVNSINAGEAIVVNNKLLVADYNNSRVLIWNRVPQTNGVLADVVIGQPDLVSNSFNQCNCNTPAANTLNNPIDLATDGQRLLVVDANNNRILVYNSIPVSNNASADVVIGQPNMNTRTGPSGAAGLSFPLGVDYDKATGKIIVADEGNSRVLIYNQIPTSNGVAADSVIGRSNFSGGPCGNGTVSSITTNFPFGASIYNGKVIIADTLFHRVLIYNSVPIKICTPADIVIGQADFVHGSINQGGVIGSNTMSNPTHADVDSRGRLFVIDRGNNRVLIYNSIPTVNNAPADLVMGQANFSDGSANQGGNPVAKTFSSPWSAVPNGDTLLIGDSGNNRLLIFNNILSTPSMNINSPTSQPEGKIRISGNISLGERPNYSMQKVTARVNGGNENNVTSLDGGRDNGPGNTLYEFTEDFNPTVNLGNADNYTIAFRAQSFNAEEDKRFYFTPFSLDKVTVEQLPTFSFTVNKTFRDQLKNNLTKYQIWYKKIPPTQSFGEAQWKLYIDNIAVSSENNGNITLKASLKLLAGKYQLQVRAINTMGREQISNNLNINVKASKR